MSEYIEFVLIKDKPKTKVYLVKNKHYNCVLGEIKWYSAWRQYCFYPIRDVVFSSGCLAFITDFIKKLMKDKKEDCKYD